MADRQWAGAAALGTVASEGETHPAQTAGLGIAFKRRGGSFAWLKGHWLAPALARHAVVSVMLIDCCQIYEEAFPGKSDEIVCQIGPRDLSRTECGRESTISFNLSQETAAASHSETWSVARQLQVNRPKPKPWRVALVTQPRGQRFRLARRRGGAVAWLGGLNEERIDSLTGKDGGRHRCYGSNIATSSSPLNPPIVACLGTKKRRAAGRKNIGN